MPCLRFISKCLKFREEHRLKAGDLLNHPFLKDPIDQEKVDLDTLKIEHMDSYGEETIIFPKQQQNLLV